MSKDDKNFDSFSLDTETEEQKYLDTMQSDNAAVLPDLEQGLPELNSSVSQRINKKGIAFLAAAGAIGMGLAAIAYTNVTGKGASDQAETKEERIELPEKPPFTNVPPVREEPQAQETSATQQQQTGAIDVIPATLAELPAQVTTVQSTPSNVAPTLAEKRAQSSGSVISSGDDGAQMAAATTSPLRPTSNQLATGNGPNPVVALGSVRKLNNPDSMLVKGTYIRCALETRIVSDLPGYTSCIVTDPIFSVNGKRLLIERGTKIQGEYKEDDRGVLDRVAIVWTRALTPSGRDIELVSPGTDNLGGSGHSGYYDAHWGSRLGAAILVSMVADVFNYEMIMNGPKTRKTTINSTTGAVTTTEESFDSKTVETLSKIPDRILNKTMNRPATVTINQGSILNIYTLRDIDFTPALEK